VTSHRGEATMIGNCEAAGNTQKQSSVQGAVCTRCRGKRGGGRIHRTARSRQRVPKSCQNRRTGVLEPKSASKWSRRRIPKTHGSNEKNASSRKPVNAGRFGPQEKKSARMWRGVSSKWARNQGTRRRNRVSKGNT